MRRYSATTAKLYWDLLCHMMGVSQSERSLESIAGANFSVSTLDTAGLLCFKLINFSADL